jgi:deoxyribodipyrimidine photo-lyase
VSSNSSRQLVLHSAEHAAGESVIYVMSRDQRVQDNHALYQAQQESIARNVPLLVCFVLFKTGVRAREHYEFMLEGLRCVEADLLKLNIPFMLLIGSPKDVIPTLAGHVKPMALYFDFSPLKGVREMQKHIAKSLNDVSCYVVDTHNCVPVWVASPKQEVGARTLRPKIHKLLQTYLGEHTVEITKQELAWPGIVMPINTMADMLTDFLNTIPNNNTKVSFSSGEHAAHAGLDEFIAQGLKGYTNNRNDPSLGGTSDLSPYLHFGQISALAVARRLYAELAQNDSLQPDVDALIEEMVIRKELSDNYCFYSQSYKNLSGAAQWAQNTLNKHTDDARELVYSLEDFEQARTHDTAWNAAQTQLLRTGKMHGYMRMYWAKKVLEWSKSPQDAIDTLIYLNDFYSIDGGDPNGYTGIMWSVAGVHDRPWGERPVYGSIRCMVYTGLKRKFDISAYEKQWLV